jgi:hypothetical protein
LVAPAIELAGGIIAKKNLLVRITIIAQKDESRAGTTFGQCWALQCEASVEMPFCRANAVH